MSLTGLMIRRDKKSVGNKQKSDPTVRKNGKKEGLAPAENNRFLRVIFSLQLSDSWEHLFFQQIPYSLSHVALDILVIQRPGTKCSLAGLIVMSMNSGSVVQEKVNKCSLTFWCSSSATLLGRLVCFSE